MQNSSNGFRPFQYVSSMFEEKGIGTANQMHQQVSAIQKKKNKFSEQIRQQKRQNYRKQIRQKHFKFYSEIGVRLRCNQSLQSQLFDKIIEEQNNIQVQISLSKRNDPNESIEDQDFQQQDHTKIIMQKIEQYRQKQYNEEDCFTIWSQIMDRMIGLQPHNKILNNVEAFKQIQSDLQFLIHILSKQIFYDNLGWRQWRIVKPQDFSLISQYLYQTIEVNNFIIDDRLEHLIQLIVELLIGFNLKIQTINATIFEGLQKEINWDDKCLFNELLSKVPFLYKKWDLVSHSSIFQLNVFSIMKISQIITQKANFINETDNLSLESINQTNFCLGKLLRVLKLIFFQIKLRQFDYEISSSGKKNEDFWGICQILISKIQKMVNKVFLLMKNETRLFVTIKDQGLVSKIGFSLISIQNDLTRLFKQCFDKKFIQMNSNQQQIDRQDYEIRQIFQKYQQKSSLNADNLILQFISNQIVAYKQKQFTYGQVLEDHLNFRLSANLAQLKLYSSLPKYQKLSINKLARDNQTQIPQTAPQGIRENIILSKLKLKNLLLSNVLNQVQTKYFKDNGQEDDFMVNFGEQIYSFQQIGQTKNKLQFLIINFVQQLFCQLTDFNLQLEALATYMSKFQLKQKFKALIVYQIWTSLRILNGIASSDKHNVFKQAFLLSQLIGPSKQGSIFSHIQNIYCQVSRNKGRNSKQIQIKTEIAIFIQNIVFSIFPIQGHFEQFSGSDNKKSITLAFDSSRKFLQHKIDFQNICENQDIILPFQNVQRVFSEYFLDEQTNSLLKFVLLLLEETIVELILIGIKIPLILLLKAQNLDAFNYFSNLLKSTDFRIQNKIQELIQTNRHDKIVEKADQFFQALQEGYQQQNGQVTHFGQKRQQDLQI